MVHRLKHHASENHSLLAASAKPHDFEVGQLVLQRQVRRKKSDLPFDPVPFTIDEVKGTMLTISRTGKSYCTMLVLNVSTSVEFNVVETLNINIHIIFIV